MAYKITYTDTVMQKKLATLIGEVLVMSRIWPVSASDPMNIEGFGPVSLSFHRFVQLLLSQAHGNLVYVRIGSHSVVDWVLVFNVIVVPNMQVWWKVGHLLELRQAVRASHRRLVKPHNVFDRPDFVEMRVRDGVVENSFTRSQKLQHQKKHEELVIPPSKQTRQDRFPHVAHVFGVIGCSVRHLQNRSCPVCLPRFQLIA